MGWSHGEDPEERRQRLEPGRQCRGPADHRVYHLAGGADAQIILNMGWERGQ